MGVAQLRDHLVVFSLLREQFSDRYFGNNAGHGEQNFERLFLSVRPAGLGLVQQPIPRTKQQVRLRQNSRFQPLAMVTLQVLKGNRPLRVPDALILRGT